ncbi:MAG: VOC family protein [Candidatus Bathyarchaeia archaeon]|jgi:catechol 2,3-dioxygenase-like lactoylglutathione lyase family enzyme
MIVEHVAISVSNLDKSIEFYTETLGCELIRRTTHNAYLHLSGELIELMQSGTPTLKVERPTSPEAWLNKMHDPLGLTHIGFRVENLDEMVKRIKDRGGDLVIPTYSFEPKIQYTTEPTEDKLRRVARPAPRKKYWRIAAFADPDGTILEFVER